jgi:hypothetical protein
MDEKKGQSKPASVFSFEEEEDSMDAKEVRIHFALPGDPFYSASAKQVLPVSSPAADRYEEMSKTLDDLQKSREATCKQRAYENTWDTVREMQKKGDELSELLTDQAKLHKDDEKKMNVLEQEGVRVQQLIPPVDLEDRDLKDRFKSLQSECKTYNQAVQAAEKAVIGTEPVPDLRALTDANWIFYAKARIESQDVETSAAEKCAFRLAIEMRDWHGRTFQPIECKSWDTVVTFTGHDFMQARKELIAKVKKTSDKKTIPELQEACKQLAETQVQIREAMTRYLRNTCLQAKDLDSALKLSKKAVKEFTDIVTKDKPLTESEPDATTPAGLVTQVVRCLNAGQFKKAEQLLVKYQNDCI